MAYNASSQLPGHQAATTIAARPSRWSPSCSESPFPLLLFARAVGSSLRAEGAGRGQGAVGGCRRHGACDVDARHDARHDGRRDGVDAELRGPRASNADALAVAHKPYPAALDAAPTGAVAVVHLTLKDVVHEVAPGIKYSAWAFSGGAPGPVIHVRQGQTVKMTLTQRRCDPALD